jgi:hypothetical protein
LNGAGSSSAQRGAGVAAQVVIHGSVPAALAPPPGAVMTKASIPAASIVLANLVARAGVESGWGSSGLQKSLMEVMAFHP